LKVALEKMQRHVEELHKNKLDFQYASKGLPVIFQRLHTFKEYGKYTDIVELRDAMLSVASSHWKRKKSTKTSQAVPELPQIDIFGTLVKLLADSSNKCRSWPLCDWSIFRLAIQLHI
ncbi:hypothetical protein T11_12441, partial [Trichinella zimbabwensis]